MNAKHSHRAPARPKSTQAVPVAPRPPARLYLATPALTDAPAFAGPLADAMGAADIAAVLLRLAPDDDRTLVKHIKVLADIVQGAGAALILDGLPQLVARSGADGAHMTGIAALKDALPSLKPDRIAGAGGLLTRHDAMLAAETGADYILFGEPAADGGRPSFPLVEERIAWWSDVFEAPCAGYAGTLEEAAGLAKAGADFILAGDFVWHDRRGANAAVMDVATAIGQTSTGQ